MPARLEHANFTVADPDRTAAWMADLFGWHIRWDGESGVGRSIHIGSDSQYVALHHRATVAPMERDTWSTLGALNHIGVTVNDIDALRVRVAQLGFTPGEMIDYEPGRRFYFFDHDGIEYEVVQYDD